jgi:hypothetical protein
MSSFQISLKQLINSQCPQLLTSIELKRQGDWQVITKIKGRENILESRNTKSNIIPSNEAKHREMGMGEQSS